MPGRLHGDDLIGEVLRNMEEGLFRIRGKVVVPAIYRIYLNPEDYEPFRDVSPFIVGEIRSALDDRLATLNKSKLLKKPEPHVKIADGWTVELHPDLDGKLERGEIEVYSDLGSPEKPDYGGGSLTRRIIPQAAESATTRTSAPSETKEETVEEDGTKGRSFAYLKYADEEGPKVFEMTKNQIVIGRGGRSYWVDVRLTTLPDVSREHCRIRRDPETGRFTIEDISQFGTAVNGKPVGKNSSMELPNRGTIGLAGVIDMQWEAA